MEAAQPFTAYTPTVTGVTTSARLGSWHRHGDHMTVEFDITLSGTPSGTIEISLPVNASSRFGSMSTHSHPRGVCMGVAGAATVPGLVVITAAGLFRLHTTTAAGGAYFSAGVPVAWGSGHIISGHLEYEAA